MGWSAVRPTAAVKLQGVDQVKNKAFWQPCQPPASYFPSDVITDVGLYSWASAFGSVPPTTYRTACALVEYSFHFQTEARGNLLGQSVAGLSFPGLRYINKSHIREGRSSYGQ